MGRPPSLTTIRSTSEAPRSSVGIGPLADAEDRGGKHDADRDEHHDADRQQHTEVADHRHQRELQRHEGDDPGEGGSDQRRGQVGHRLGDRVLVVVEHDLLLDAVVDLDREVDAEPDQDRQAGDRHQREVDADQSEDRERPDHADQHGEQRQQPPANAEHQRQHDHHDGDRRRTEGQHAALQIVVDLLQVDGRARHGEVESLERRRLENRQQVLGGSRLIVEAEIPVEHDAADGGLLVGERAGERQSDPAGVVGGRLRHTVDDLEAGVVEDQQVDVLGVRLDAADFVIEEALRLRDLATSGQAHRDVVAAGRSPGLVPGRGGEQRRLPGTRQQGVAVGQRRERRDHREDVVDRGELDVETPQFGEVGPGVEVGDVPALLGAEQQDDRFTAEVVLELDIVDGDL